MRKLKLSRRLRIAATALTVAAYGTLFGIVVHHNVFVSEAEAATAAVATVAPAKVESVEEQGQLRAAIGMAEYLKRPTETTQNCNCGPLIDQYTQGNPGQWCTMFASWVANEAGTPMYSSKTGTWRIRQSRDMMRYLQANGEWVSAEQARRTHERPRPGDYIILYHGQWKENLGHAALVVKSTGPAGTADILNGNNNATIVYDDNFEYETHSGFLGFGRPVNK